MSKRNVRFTSVLIVWALILACGGQENVELILPPPAEALLVEPGVKPEEEPVPVEEPAPVEPVPAVSTAVQPPKEDPLPGGGAVTGATGQTTTPREKPPAFSGSGGSGQHTTTAPPRPSGASHTSSTTPAPADPPEPPPAEPSPVMASGIDAWLAALPIESLVFNTPAQILYGEQVELRLIVQPGEEGAALQASFEASRKASQAGEVQVAEARLSEEVGATLVSPGLTVTALTPERQFVSRVEPTEWRWAVQGNAEGEHEMSLSLYAILPEHSSVRVLKTFERSMKVEVPPRQAAVGFVKDNWEWMWTFLLAPIGGWAWSRWRRKGE